jgi:GNAT superfamily N-acetyltransferase
MKNARSPVTGADAMSDYRIRPATLDDVDVLVHHRIAMFSEMGTSIEADSVAKAFGEWVTKLLPAGTYRGWVVEGPSGDIVAGGGMTILPWPPGPWYVGGRIAFVYNVYTAPAHRRRGLARMIMDAIHAGCRDEGIGLAGLNASRQAQRLYESMGYQQMPAPMMIASLNP